MSYNLARVKMPSLFLDHALLPLGWSANVRMDIESGRIAAVTADAHADGAQHCPGIALPGLPNLHSHTFQRGMAGFAERRGDSEDNFWTWRQVMYHFLGLLTPDDIEAIAPSLLSKCWNPGSPASLNSITCITLRTDGPMTILPNCPNASSPPQAQPASA
jgi:cytosine/adenosine deaminase-related metal-dependent hydrolase